MSYRNMTFQRVFDAGNADNNKTFLRALCQDMAAVSSGITALTGEEIGIRINGKFDVFFTVSAPSYAVIKVRYGETERTGVAVTLITQTATTGTYKITYHLAVGEKTINLKLIGATTQAPYFDIDFVFSETDGGLDVIAIGKKSGTNASTARPFALDNALYIGAEESATYTAINRVPYLYDSSSTNREIVSGKILAVGGTKSGSISDLVDCSQIDGDGRFTAQDGTEYYSINDHTLVVV